MTVKGVARDDLLDHIYDIALEPERFEQLVDRWAGRLGRGRARWNLEALADPALSGHLARAERVLSEIVESSTSSRDRLRDWVEGLRSAAILVDRGGTVVAANASARAVLGLRVGSHLQDMPVATADRDELAALAGRLAIASSKGNRLLRLQMTEGLAPVLVRLVEAPGGSVGYVGIVTSVLGWTKHLSAELKAAFDLTDTELDVLRQLVSGSSVKEICARTGRSEPTLRTHISALLDKTDTRSQIELVRMTLALLDAAEPAPAIDPLAAPPGIAPGENCYETHFLADGRRADFLLVGARNGRRALFLPTDIGFTRFPRAAEDWLAGRAITLVVPVRAGYGHSSPPPTRRRVFDVAVEDTLSLLDSLGIERLPVLSMCDDFRLAVELATKVPKRVTAIVAMAPTPPASTPEHFKRMGKWTRLIAANAVHAPGALPFLAMAGFHFARRIGPKRFMQALLADSPSDLAQLDDEAVMTAILQGSEIAIGPRFSAHAAYAAGVVAGHGSDWSRLLERCPVPMVLFAGAEDPLSPILTTREFAARLPNIVLHEHPHLGALLYPIWPEIFAELERHLGN
jgi:pimeloyl-ACP methyl ester carboxylesterase/DNA-binding CsgD family transcriptional regulator